MTDPAPAEQRWAVYRILPNVHPWMISREFPKIEQAERYKEALPSDWNLEVRECGRAEE